MSEMMTAGHLGGYLPGGDPDTFFPEMWEWMIDTWAVKSVIDIGCGDGAGALAYFTERLGDNTLGIEGMPLPEDCPMRHRIIEWDYARGPYDPFYGRDLPPFDLAWSAEFLEHVEERYVPNFMATFKCARFALVTHGEPGQPGHHHVNNQTDDYWKGVFAANGFEFDASLTAMTRKAASANTRTFNHYRSSGLAFRRYE